MSESCPTFGLSPPEASLSFSCWELSLMSCSSAELIIRLPILYPEEPAPRGLEGHELAALRRDTTNYLLKRLLHTLQHKQKTLCLLTDFLEYRSFFSVTYTQSSPAPVPLRINTVHYSSSSSSATNCIIITL